MREGRGELLKLDDNLKSILLSSKDTEDAFVRISGELRKIDDKGTLSSTLDTLFSESGRKLSNFFSLTKVEVRQLKKEAQKSGAIITTEDTKKAALLNSEIQQLQTGLAGIRNEVGRKLVDGFASVLDKNINPKVLELIGYIKDIDENKISRTFEKAGAAFDRSFGGILAGIREVNGFLAQQQEDEKINELVDIRQVKRRDIIEGTSRSADLSNIGRKGLGQFVTAGVNLAKLGSDKEIARKQLEGSRILSKFEGSGSFNADILEELKQINRKTNSTPGFGLLDGARQTVTQSNPGQFSLPNLAIGLDYDFQR